VWGEWEFNAEEMNLYIQSTLYTCMELPQWIPPCIINEY
jgi:hypothetical protein